MQIAERMDRMGTELAFEYYGRASAMEATGRDVVHFEVGEPDFDTSAHIRAVAKQALDDGFTHYAPTMGLRLLREVIAQDAGARRGFTIDPENVVITPGAKVAMFLALLATAGPGDEVIYPDPGFPMYRAVARYVGATAVPVPIRQENGFRLDPDELAAVVTARTKLLILNSPANPTGGALTRADLQQIAHVAIEHDLFVMSDEIYGRILYEGEHISIAAEPGMADRTIVVDGFSKTYAMTGWRLGYLLLPPSLTGPFGSLVFNSYSSTAIFAQMAAVEAIRGPQDDVDRMVGEFRARRDLVVAGLNQIPGFDCILPQGAFYVFPQVRGTGFTGAQLADRLLAEGGVSVLPGIAFGDHGGDHIRISYACSMATIERGLHRIREVVEHGAV